MNPPLIRSADVSERAAIIDVITLAFATDPLLRWVLPSPTAYLTACRDFVDAFGCNGLPHGTAFVIDDLSGAALWLQPGIEPDRARLGEVMGPLISPPVVADFVAVVEQMGAYHPHEPHWYLPLIGVDPARHGHGLGAALMRHAVERFDREGAVAYLESSNQRNVSLYERHGFHALAAIQIGASPVVTPMLRRPS